MKLETPHPFDGHRVEEALGDTLPTLGVLWVPESISTNRDLMKMAETGAPDWTVFVADRQTQGRGRRSRPWLSPDGGLYCSVLLNLQTGSSPITLVPLTVGLAVSEAIQSEGKRLGGSIEINLKWPNDLVTDRGKLGGVLCETAHQGDSWLVVAGVGLNIEPLEGRVSELPRENDPTSLCEEYDAKWEREALLIAILSRLTSRLDEWKSDPAFIRTAWSEASGLLGKQIRVRTGGSPVTGIAEGINEIGALRVRTEEGVVEINAAEGIEVRR